MRDQTCGCRQRGVALLMSLIFLLLLAIAAAALLDTVVWQNRLGVAQQQARDQFQRLRGAIAYTSHEMPGLANATDSAKACEWKTLKDPALVAQVPEGYAIQTRRLRVAYDCRATGDSESMCKPVEVAGVTNNDASSSGISQIQGVEIVTPRLTDQRMATFSNVPEGSCQ
ncbi:hypothetical protein F0A16_16675 [Salinicola corii]|uniref:Type 4 fimbrial biogenesis protein PilX N-terminal domain-containing protein n=1 Tax=Salinicola corii TaxID=2606937 RepID=A0A640W958_9GAMM|nr:hypothetical protein [Salinicola corii]KAA0016706.1 hypothetical protein F0A16_16675 [Salinicola corii]